MDTQANTASPDPFLEVRKGSDGGLLRHDLMLRLSGRVAIVGVGDDRRGDDGAGPLVARLLAGAQTSSVIDSGSSPELDTWRLRELMPESVLFVDAVDFGGTPGDLALLTPADLCGTGFDTHRAPLRLTMEYLERALECKCYLLAVQPKDVRHGAPMTGEVKRVSEYIAEILRRDIVVEIDRRVPWQ